MDGLPVPFKNGKHFMKTVERQRLIRLLQNLTKEQPRWISVCTVLALVQSLDALEKLKTLHQEKMQKG